jgi:hypothetical protein
MLPVMWDFISGCSAIQPTVIDHRDNTSYAEK